MRKFLLMLLAVLSCTAVLCTVDVHADSNTSDDDTKQTTISDQNSNQNINQNTVQNENQLTDNTKVNAYSEEEVYLTAQLVYHEAHNQDFDGKVAIAEVVLNRVNSSFFPNTIEDVLYQKGQFAGKNGLRKCQPTDEEIELTNRVLNGDLRVFNDSSVLYFRNPKITSGISAKTVKNWGKLKYFTYIGEHAFYSQIIITDTDLDSIPTQARTMMASADKSAKKNAAGKVNAMVDEEGDNQIADTLPSDYQVVAMAENTQIQINPDVQVGTEVQTATEMPGDSEMQAASEAKDGSGVQAATETQSGPEIQSTQQMQISLEMQAQLLALQNQQMDTVASIEQPVT